MPNAGRYPIVQGGQTIKKFFDVVIEQPRPEGSLNLTKWLRSSGLTSSYFDDMPPVMRFIEMVDTNDQTHITVASNTWTAIRDSQSGHKALIESLQRAYGPILNHFGIGQVSQEDITRISSFIRTNENAAAADAEAAAQTMIRLFDFALGRQSTDVKPLGGPKKTGTISSGKAKGAGVSKAQVRVQNHEVANSAPRGTSVLPPPTPQIAVQVNIDPSATPEQIDAIFQSMAKHLYRQN